MVADKSDFSSFLQHVVHGVPEVANPPHGTWVSQSRLEVHGEQQLHLEILKPGTEPAIVFLLNKTGELPLYCAFIDAF